MRKDNYFPPYMLPTLLLAVIILVACVVLLSVSILLKKGGHFPNTHVSGQKALRDRGITCVQSQDYAMRHRKSNIHTTSMKRHSTTGALLLSAATLLLAACAGQDNDTTSADSPSGDSSAALKIAYINIDTLTSQYQMWKDEADSLAVKQQNAESTIQAKGQNFASQVQALQRKVQTNSISQQEFEQEQARLAQLQQNIEEFQSRLSASLQEEYAAKLQAMTDTIKNFVDSYAQEKGYDLILCKSSGIDNVLYANASYDVTEEVVNALNKRYKQKGKKATAKTEKTAEE